ncbi:MAG: AAC(3) family N-acetyltransferase [Clostridiales bacterium]|jgi:aminoglycoside 3-N-acetyltransferase|nr:AAC(3) family N-acetyltransferase [Clostridiales bacterium]
MDQTTIVKLDDIVRAYHECGVNEGDILLTHSSLKSFGYVEGGAETVIEAAEKAVGPTGTVVFPTLVQRDFDNAYKNWDKDKSPSDVGYITEVFRLQSGSLRSDQATHSVAARGRLAYELTKGHTDYGPRMGVFGDYCFSYSSPWQKMYLLKAKVVFIGVSTLYNTFKHFAEYCFVEETLQSIKDINKRCLAMSEISVYHNPARKWPNGVWPFHDANVTESALEEAGLLKRTRCGNSVFTCIRADQYVDFVLDMFRKTPQKLINEKFCSWLEKYTGNEE